MNKLMMSAMLAALSVVAGCTSTGAPKGEGASGGAAAKPPAAKTAADAKGGAAACAGNWKIEFQTPMGAQTVTMKLAQSGTQVTGKASDPMAGENDITGTCDAGAFSLSETVQSPMGALDMKFAGTASGDSMSGKVVLGPMGEMPFTGTKQ